MAIDYRFQIRRLMPMALRIGMNPTAYFALSLTEWGHVYRRTDFFRDWHEFSGRKSKRNPLKAITLQHRPTVATMVEAEYKQKKMFNYNYDYEGIDVTTGELKKTTITVASDKSLTMGQAEIIARVDADVYKTNIEDGKLTRESVTYRRKKAKYVKPSGFIGWGI